jgi:hypothetical protein
MTRTAIQPRRFWLLWTASTATDLGDGMRLVALPLLASSTPTDGNLRPRDPHALRLALTPVPAAVR